LGLQEIINKIKEETELKRQEILDKAIAERDRILKEAEERSKEILKKSEEEKQKRVNQRLNALIADYVIKSNIALSESKREILSGVYKEALRRVREDSRIYESIVKFLFDSLNLGGDEEIVISEDETLITSDFIDKINRDKGWNLKLSQKRANIEGGFLAIGSKIRVDASLEKIMEILQEETEVHVSKILFH
jgi:vacuolar-type H+-ATPase subunit E/Vma4